MFYDDEINKALSSGIELYKSEGKLSLVTDVAEEHKDLLKELIEAIEQTLGKPLLWLLDEPKRKSF